MTVTFEKLARANEEVYFRRIDAEKLEKMRAEREETLVMPKAEEAGAEEATAEVKVEVPKKSVEAQ